MTLPRKGVHARLLDAAGTRSEEPHLSEAVVGGLLIPSHGYVAAGELTRALTTAARRHGAQLIERGRVRRIVSAGGDLRVETDRGSLSGNGVVLAAGSWSGQIEIEGVGRAAARPAGPRPAAAARVDRPARSDASSGANAAISCRGKTARCWLARRSRRPASTSGPRPPGSAI